MNQRIKTIFSFCLRFGLSGLLLWYLFAKLIDLESTGEVIKSAQVHYLIIALAVFVLINFIILWRWFIFIRALDLDVRGRDVIRYFFIGLFGNLFLPSSIGGDVIKIVGLCKDHSQKPRVVASVILDRLSGFAAIVLVATCAFIFGHSLIDDQTLIWPILFITLGSVAIMTILFNERIYAFFCQIFNIFPRLKKGLMHVHYNLMLLKDKKKEGLKGIVISCVAQSTLCVCFYLIARGLNQDASIVYFLIFVPLICVASIVPSIGGLGVREAGAAYLFSKIGMETGIAVSISLIIFLFMVFVGLIGGIIYVFTFSSRRIQHQSSDIDVKPENA